MFVDLKDLFVNMGVVNWVLISVGLAVIIASAFIPKKVWIGVIGFGLLAGGLIGRLINGVNFMQGVYLILICLIIVFPFMIVAYKVDKKYDFYKKVESKDREVVIPTNAELKDVDLNILVGRTAVAHTDLKPIGKIKIDKEIFEAKTDGEFVRVGEKVKITKINKENVLFVKSKKR